MTGASTANYNLIFKNNVSTGSMTIKQRSLDYTIAGSHTYGDMDGTSQKYFSKGVTGLVNGDKQTDVVNGQVDESQLTVIGNASRNAAGINGATHVKRDASGEVVACVTDASLKLPDGQGISINAANHNYKAISTKLTYTVHPADLVYTVADNTKVYGNTALDHANSGSFSGFANGETLATVHNDTTTKANNTTLADTDYAVDSDILAANKEVKRNNTTETAGKYADGISVDTSKLYLNDYKVTSAKGGVTITPKNLTVTAGNGSHTYGDSAAPSVSGNAVFTGLIDSDSGLAAQNGHYTQAVDSLIGQYTDSGTYAGKTSVVLKDNTTYKNYAVTLQNGDFTVDRRAINYTVDAKSREYGADNPIFTGTFTGVPTDEAAEKVTTTPAQSDYTLATTNAGSDKGTYGSEIGLAVASGTNIGRNYTLGTVTPGTLTITQAQFYYQANPKQYWQGNAAIGTDKQTGIVVNNVGKDMSAYLLQTDRDALGFTTLADSTSTVGSYAITGFGVTGNKNYTMAALPQWATNATALTIVAPQDDNYRNAIQPPAMGNKFSQDTANRVNGLSGTGTMASDGDVATNPQEAKDIRTGAAQDNGGYIPKEATGSLRFLTNEDTVINIAGAGLTSNPITVDASSRTDGGTTTTIGGTGEISTKGTTQIIHGTTIGTANTNLVLGSAGVSTLGNPGTSTLGSPAGTTMGNAAPMGTEQGSPAAASAPAAMPENASSAGQSAGVGGQAPEGLAASETPAAAPEQSEAVMPPAAGPDEIAADDASLVNDADEEEDQRKKKAAEE